MCTFYIFVLLYKLLLKLMVFMLILADLFGFIESIYNNQSHNSIVKENLSMGI